MAMKGSIKNSLNNMPSKIPSKLPIRVLFVGAELTPLAKAGGLGDVLGSLPKAIANQVDSVCMAIPFHQEIPRSRLKTLHMVYRVSVQVGKTSVPVTVWQSVVPGTTIPLYLFHNSAYLSRGRIYQGTSVHDPTTRRLAKSKPGQILRYLVFSFAVYEFIKRYRSDVTIVHGHDYHIAGLLALVAHDKNLQHIKRLLTIHNLGVVGAGPQKYLRLFSWKPQVLFGAREFSQRRGARLLHLGIQNATVVNTVSPQYAKEILTPQYGNSLDQLLRKKHKRILGILNGIDTTLFNPATDSNIAAHYTYTTLTKKAKNKTWLQKHCGLPVNPDIPLIGLASRLSKQKGLELLIELLPKLATLPAQFVFTGAGDPVYASAFTKAQQQFPRQLYFHNQFDVKFAQYIYAGSDMFLMPSLFEPCGLSQIIAMRYGSVPIVRATGGLKDTVHNTYNGFTFTRYSSQALWRALVKAMNTYYTAPQRWSRLIRHGMTEDYSWDRSAKRYIQLYKNLLTHV